LARDQAVPQEGMQVPPTFAEESTMFCINSYFCNNDFAAYWRQGSGQAQQPGALRSADAAGPDAGAAASASLITQGFS